MKYLLWLSLVVFNLGYYSGYAQNVINDANAQVRQVGSFANIEVSSAIDLYISQGNTTGVAVSAATADYTNDMVTEVRGNTLYIGLRNGMGWNSGNRKMRAYVSAPNLNRIKAGGACTVRMEGGFKATDLEVNMSGASDFKGSLQAENLRLYASGSSDIILQGRATNVKIDVSGSSDVKAMELQVDFADIQASGASDVHITVNKEMKVQASGSSDVLYRGEARLREVSVSGASDIKKKS